MGYNFLYIKSIDLADEKFVKNITLIKFFKRKFLLDFERILTVTAHVYKHICISFFT